MSKRRRRLAPLALAAALAACAGDAPEGADTPATQADTATDPRRAIDDEAVAGQEATRAFREMLQASASSWNAGDLAGFLDDYLDSPRTVFIGSTRTYGRDEVRRRYEEGYWADGIPPQELAFDSMEVQPLGARHALAHGRYVLTGREDADAVATGYFTLILVRTDDGWRIMHDHSSAGAAPDTTGG